MYELLLSPQSPPELVLQNVLFYMVMLSPLLSPGRLALMVFVLGKAAREAFQGYRHQYLLVYIQVYTRALVDNHTVLWLLSQSDICDSNPLKSQA